MASTQDVIKVLDEKFGTQGFTWKESGFHYNTLNSYVKKGMLEKADDRYKVTNKGRNFIRILVHVKPNGFISLRKKGSAIGMLCTVKDGYVYDAWEHLYDYSDVDVYFSEGSWKEL